MHYIKLTGGSNYQSNFSGYECKWILGIHILVAYNIFKDWKYENICDFSWEQGHNYCY